jgi:hypothetical protein
MNHEEFAGGHPDQHTNQRYGVVTGDGHKPWTLTTASSLPDERATKR